VPVDLTPFLGQVIRDLRESAGISQEDAAARADVDRTYWSGIERGTRSNPSIKTLQRLIRVFDVDLDDFFAKVRRLAEQQAQT